MSHEQVSEALLSSPILSMQLKNLLFSAMAESDLSKPDVEAQTHGDDVIVSTEPPSTGTDAYYFSTLFNYYCLIFTIAIVSGSEMVAFVDGSITTLEGAEGGRHTDAVESKVVDDVSRECDVDGASQQPHLHREA